MESIKSSDLKTILHSKRANIYYLEHCRVLVNGGRVEYVTERGKQCHYWNIPIANTTSILLGTGTSITQAAMRELAKAGVMVGFCGGGGTPLFTAGERDHEVTWLAPQSEYRPTEYLQSWASFWFDDERRLLAAKQLQRHRIMRVQNMWLENHVFADQGFAVNRDHLMKKLQQSMANIDVADTVQQLLLEEARLTKNLYAMAAQATEYGDFSRSTRGNSFDPANQFLDHGNYLAYGLAATTAWVLGLPHGLAVLHGKTRRGGLVFDIADLIKDATILPQAFLSAQEGVTDSEYRKQCIQVLTRTEALDFMIDCVKEIALHHSVPLSSMQKASQ